MSLTELIRVAERSPNKNRHAAGIYLRTGKLILAVSNRFKEHAEYRCIQRYFAVDKFRSQRIYSIVIIRVTKSGKNLSYSKPCKKCSKLLNQLNIKVIHS